jgi:hypothetical protein
MSRYRTVVLATAIALLGMGCKVVPVDQGSETVRVIDQTEAASCERVGSGKFTVLDKILFVSRSDEQMANDLVKLARNDALEMGGNAVLPEGDIEDGTRRFGLYRCPGS